MANMNSIGEYIRQQREQAKISLRQLAEQAGVSNPYLSQVERGLRKPSADILQQIAKGLRISAEALYVQAGILEDRPGDSGVRSALLTDPQLTERQKQVLIEIYESFRKESQKPPTAEVVAITREQPARSESAEAADAAWPTATAETDTAETDTAETDSAETDSAQTDTAQTDSAETGSAETGSAAPAGQPETDGPSESV
jgi:transcriptional regulator with XRE-family HTH domain